MPSSSRTSDRGGELPRAAVDHDEIGPGTGAPLGVLPDQAAEPAAENLAHHPIVVAGLRCPFPGS